MGPTQLEKFFTWLYESKHRIEIKDLDLDRWQTTGKPSGITIASDWVVEYAKEAIDKALANGSVYESAADYLIPIAIEKTTEGPGPKVFIKGTCISKTTGDAAVRTFQSLDFANKFNLTNLTPKGLHSYLVDQKKKQLEKFESKLASSLMVRR